MIAELLREVASAAEETNRDFLWDDEAPTPQSWARMLATNLRVRAERLEEQEETKKQRARIARIAGAVSFGSGKYEEDDDER